MHGDTKHDAEDGSPGTQEAAPGEASAPETGAPTDASYAGPMALTDGTTTPDEADRAGIFPDETPRGEVQASQSGASTPVQVDVVEVGPDADIEETLGEAAGGVAAGELVADAGSTGD